MDSTTTKIALVIGVIGALFIYKAIFDGAEPVLDPENFRKFLVSEITPVSHNTAVYSLKFKDPKTKLNLPIGQHVTIKADIDGKEVARSYTPISDPDTVGHVKLLVKSYPTGLLSKHFAELKVGDYVLMRGPKGSFKYEPDTLDHICMVAGGSGITPMFQILQRIAETKEDKTKVTLIFGNQTEGDILLRQRLDDLVKMKPDQLKVHYILDTAPEEWNGFTGFVTKNLMEKVFPEPAPNRKFLLCGPFPMVNAAKNAAVELGWQKPKLPCKAEDQIFIF